MPMKITVRGEVALTTARDDAKTENAAKPPTRHMNQNHTTSRK
jgi:hypothetical protein